MSDQAIMIDAIFLSMKATQLNCFPLSQSKLNLDMQSEKGFTMQTH